jgi:hypothetical protein
MHVPGTFQKNAKQQLDAAIHRARTVIRYQQPDALWAFEYLVEEVRGRAQMLRAGDSPGDQRVSMVDALLALSLHHEDWLRPVRDWSPGSLSVRAQFATLASHLLARYPVPGFMTLVWFGGPRGARLPEHQLYKHLGSGQSIRTAGLPVRLTRSMAHHFSRAPHQCTVVEALRWGQVLGRGGTEELARAVLATRLGKELAMEACWEDLLTFLVANPSMELEHVGPVVDYLHWKFSELAGGHGAESAYSLKGRTPASLLREVREWHRGLRWRGSVLREPESVWERSPVAGFEWTEAQPVGEDEAARTWTIRELLSSADLFLEGRAMRHCVFSYTDRCRSRKCSIWSLKVKQRDREIRIATIELELATRIIRQVRGPRNRLPRAAELEMVQRWAADQRLRILVPNPA